MAKAESLAISFSRFFRAGHFEVVYPVLPMDILGLYVVLPDSQNHSTL